MTIKRLPLLQSLKLGRVGRIRGWTCCHNECQWVEIGHSIGSVLYEARTVAPTEAISLAVRRGGSAKKGPAVHMPE